MSNGHAPPCVCELDLMCFWLPRTGGHPPPPYLGQVKREMPGFSFCIRTEIQLLFRCCIFSGVCNLVFIHTFPTGNTPTIKMYKRSSGFQNIGSTFARCWEQHTVVLGLTHGFLLVAIWQFKKKHLQLQLWYFRPVPWERQCFGSWCFVFFKCFGD